MSVAEIFETHGEAAFRDYERRVIKRLLGDGPLQWALGGCLCRRRDPRFGEKQKALCVWLDVPLDELVTRVKKTRQAPLLIGQDVQAKLAHLLSQREAAYAEADIRAKLGSGSHEAAITIVLEALATHLTKPSLTQGNASGWTKRADFSKAKL